MRIGRAFLRSITVVMLSLNLLSFGMTRAGFAEAIKIGLLAPLTGPSASDGEEFIKGSQWAIDDVNAKGGIAGYTFELVIADVKDLSAANTTSAVERLLGIDGIHFILTGYASLSLFEVELMAKAGMPYIAAGPSPSFAAITSRFRPAAMGS